jgi:3-hydroxyacyl-CoA dehydrogenase / enoyl-CoA hydratase / 3-hydroxybutyryl-CoA epimerase
MHVSDTEPLKTTPSSQSQPPADQQTSLHATPESLLSLEHLPNGLAILTLGQTQESAIALSERRLKELSTVFSQLHQQPPIGLIIQGNRPEMFTVGVDLFAIRHLTDPQEGVRLAQLGQHVFDLLATLPCPTVAAISGPCVGGGFEMALACKIRLCSDHRSTLIGLPEIKLGIIPGFGGCQRLPRLIGVTKALDIILAGKTLGAKQAFAAGLVNEIVATHHLKTRAESLALQKANVKPSGLSIKERFLTYTALGRRIVKNATEKMIEKKVGAYYPAPSRALSIIMTGLDSGHAAGQAHEAQAIGELITTPESQALVRIFFLTEEAKSIGKGAESDVREMNGIVIGAGVMGEGIAETFARKGLSVTLKDINATAIANAKNNTTNRIRKSSSLSSSEQEGILDKYTFTAEEAFPISTNNFVIEAVVENLSVKAQVLNALSARLPATTIFASNTSSLSINAMAETIADPSRFIGMHFFNPVAKMPLVEIIRGKATSEKTIVITAALARKLGKVPIVVEDVPGFLINRILSPYLNCAAMLFEKGYSVQLIDGAAVSFGFPMGPLRLLDEIGHDVASHVSVIMEEAYGARMKSSNISQTLVRAKALGKKSKLGIYNYSANVAAPRGDIREVLGFSTTAAAAPMTQQKVAEALLLSMVQEAVRCLDEGVAGQPSANAAGQIDLGTVMGIGFPAFRGGILSYASVLTASAIKNKLLFLREEFASPLFDVPVGIESRSVSGKSFAEPI